VILIAFALNEERDFRKLEKEREKEKEKLEIEPGKEKPKVLNYFEINSSWS
jgi:hypothetical protein